ncbi:MAG: hypothetical protein RQ922_03350 [Thermoproteota archaeon]|nr:hypothetical protein [Thermoproteota archaeon]
MMTTHSFHYMNEEKFTNAVKIQSKNIAKIVLGIIFTFLCSLTLGNTPYAFAGYGLSAFTLFLIGYIFSRREAIIAYIIGLVFATLLLLYTASIFLLVAIAFVIVRSLQMLLLVYLKNKYGLLSSTLITVFFGSFAATLLGIGYYGEGALSTALSFYDIIYSIPAFLAYRFTKFPSQHNVLGILSSILLTFLLFFSISTFFVISSFILALISFLILLFIISTKIIQATKRINIIITSVLIILLIGYITFFFTSSSNYILRATYYPLYPDSLSMTQWYQKKSNPECQQGNLAGDWTEEGGVWGPQRLRVLDTCVTVTGTIVGLLPQKGPATDNDYIIEIKLDPQYQYILSIGSYWFKNGYLHVEIIPKDQPKVLSNLNLEIGMRVKITGVWVLDTDHGWWSELHPVWKIEVIS